MYDRAARFLDSKSVLSNVGPGSYEICDTTTTSRCEGYAPFSALHPRTSFLGIKNNPGPGAYNPNHIYDHIKGGSSVGNRSKRFHEKLSETPGPGNYDISSALSNTKTHKETETKNAVQRRPADPPSIPCPGQAFGYEEGVDGVLRKQKVPNVDKSLGPAFYKPNHHDTAATMKYKGIHFGAQTGKRGDDKGDDTPGPGAYSVHQAPRNLNVLIVSKSKIFFVNYKPIMFEIIN